MRCSPCVRGVQEIDKYCTQDVVVTLVGNKLDLSENVRTYALWVCSRYH
jgi:hypothetical protein